MPRYDHRCRQCGDTFEVTRSITRLDEPAPCPAGHSDTVRLLNTVGVLGGSRGTTTAGSSGPAASGGGCCGGGCCG